MNFIKIAYQPIILILIIGLILTKEINFVSFNFTINNQKFQNIIFLFIFNLIVNILTKPKKKYYWIKPYLHKIFILIVFLKGKHRNLKYGMSECINHSLKEQNIKMMMKVAKIIMMHLEEETKMNLLNYKSFNQRLKHIKNTTKNSKSKGNLRINLTSLIFIKVIIRKDTKIMLPNLK